MATSRYYLSVVIESMSKDSFVDSVADIVIHDLKFDPIPYTNRVILGMSLNKQLPTQY